MVRLSLSAPYFAVCSFPCVLNNESAGSSGGTGAWTRRVLSSISESQQAPQHLSLLDSWRAAEAGGAPQAGERVERGEGGV